jgi:hypothetical protein
VAETPELTIDLSVVVACKRCGRRFDLAGLHEVPREAEVLAVSHEIDGCPECEGPDEIPGVTAAE